MYKILLEKNVTKFLEKHKGEALIHRFTESLLVLSMEPYENNLDIKILIGLPNTYILRIGKYRFLYEIIEDKIIINFFDAGSRGDIYK
ncbi:type II toxin-antitoxin system RelE/ParE family toxin [Candidatus Gracilibacteria bacterium]|nr:type II toxin-antitoxin system RelE/ParE family toxin [Candidatus Gracilibacteria bacterium]